MTLQTEMSSPCYISIYYIYMKVEALALAKLRDCFVRVFERCFLFLSCFWDLREMALAPKAKEIIVSTTFHSSSPLNLMNRTERKPFALAPLTWEFETQIWYCWKTSHAAFISDVFPTQKKKNLMKALLFFLY